MREKILYVALAVALGSVACGDDCKAPETVKACEDCGFVYRPSPGGAVECEGGETEVSHPPLGIEGGVCCDPG